MTYDAIEIGAEEPTVSALALVDTLKPEFVFMPGNMDSILMRIREQALAEVAGLNISTPKMRKQFKDTKNKVVKSRTYIEKMRVGYVSAEKKRLATVDTEARRIKDILQGIEDEVARPLTEWEAVEDARVQAHNDELKEVHEAGAYTSTNWMTLSLEAMRDRLQEIEQNNRDWQEFAVPAAQEEAEAIRLIKEAITKRETYDREQAELAKLRAEAAERAEKERLDAIAKAAVEAARVTIREEVIAELTPARSNFIPVDKMEGFAADAPKVSFYIGDQRVKVIEEVTESFISYVGVQDLEVSDIRGLVEDIAKGLIPHVTITY